MINKPLISIITLTYNHEDFIEKCIESVRDQTYTKWELIVVDDCSTDKSNKILSRFALGDSRIKIIRHKKNWGIVRLSRTYNQALKKAHGSYIAILEGDDYWPKNKLAVQIKTFKNPNVVLSYGDCVFVNKSGYPIKLLTYSRYSGMLNNLPKSSVIKLFNSLRFNIIPVTVMIRKKTLLQIGGFKSDKFYPFADLPTFLNLSLMGQFVYIKDIIGFYRKQKNSNWYNFAKNTSAMGREEVLKCVNNFISEKKLNIVKQPVTQSSRYIKYKKFIRPGSIYLNDTAFKGKLNFLTLYFLIEYLIYKLKKIFNNVK